MTANVKKYVVVVCHEDKINQIYFSWKWGENKLRTVDQYTYLDVETSKKDRSWDTHLAKVNGNSKAHVGNMDATVTDTDLDAMIKRCIPVKAITPKLEYAGEV